MKRVWKLLSLCLAISIAVFWSFAGRVEAANGSLGISASAETLHPGDTVTVTMTVANNPGLITLAAHATYDPSVFSLVSKSIGSLLIDSATLPAANETDGQVTFDLGNETSDANITSTGTFATFVLSVKSGATNGTTQIEVVNDEAYDVDIAPVTLSGSSVSITITGGTCTHGNLSYVPASAALCESAGNIEYYYCPDCGKYFGDAGATNEISADSIVIPVLGHDWDEGTITTPATCETDGVKTFVCQNDNAHTRTEVVAALGHDWDEGVVTTPATCTVDGVKTYTCSRCGDTKTETIPAIGHVWDDGEIISEATATETGEIKYICAVCGDEKYEAFELKYGVPKVDSSASAVTDEAKAKLEGAIPTTEGYSGNNIAFYEISLGVSKDNGKTYTTANADAMPAAGVSVVIPYPTGTKAEGYDFMVLHLLSGGSVEKLNPKETTAGLEVTAKSLSPFAVVYKTTKTEEVAPVSNSSQNESAPSASDSSAVVMSPKTGESSNMIAPIAIAIFLGIGAYILVRTGRLRRK